MAEDDNLHLVRSLLLDYVKSPSLRHIRDPHFLNKLAKEILKSLDRKSSVWRKWDDQREQVLRSASQCWIPVEDLRAFLNGLPGPALTATDVEQRLRAFHEEAFASYPDARLRDGCLAIYARELDAGTEIPAIVGALQEFVENEQDRLRIVAAQQAKDRAQDEKEAQLERLLSGADCKWTPLNKPSELFKRLNGRLYRLTQGRDKRWSLFRVASHEDDKGTLLGQYLRRGDANKVVAQMAYQAEPRR